MERRPPQSRNRAAAQFAWTEPLRPLHRRYSRLAAASFRLGAISLGGIVVLAIVRGRFGIGWGVGVLLTAMALFGVGGLLLGRRAAGEARRVEEEIARIEEEATRHLD